MKTTRQSEFNERYRDEIKLWLLELKQNQACIECGESHPACLTYHHRDPSEKKYAISAMGNRGCSKKLILKEIEKCDILCHNCHAKLHFTEKDRPCVARKKMLDG